MDSSTLQHLNRLKRYLSLDRLQWKCWLNVKIGNILMTTHLCFHLYISESLSFTCTHWAYIYIVI